MPNFLLRPHTFERVKQLVNASPAVAARRPARGGTTGRLPVLVLCTSSTAADATAVGSECYPGVIVDPDATQTAELQPTLGNVWLTVLDGTGAIPPVPGMPYLCLLGGPYAPGSNPRPRAFTIVTGTIYRGTTAAAIGSHATGTNAVSVTPTSGSAFTLSAYNPWAASVPSGKTCVVTWVANTGQWEVLGWDC